MRQVALGLILATGLAATGVAQLPGALDRERGRLMLRVVRDYLQRHYYDSTFHAVDLAASAARADSQIQRATSNSEIFEAIARVALQLDDSHTRFFPPGRVAEVEYGWEIQMIGDSCFVVEVAPRSDAAAKGLVRGDRVIAVDGWVPSRREFPLFGYYYGALSPRTVVRLAVESPDGARRVLEVAAKVREGERIVELFGPDGDVLRRKAEDEARTWRDRFHRIGDDILIWRMGWFESHEQIDAGVARAKSAATLILDLRSNPGGLASAWERLAGHVVDRETRAGTLHLRRRSEPITIRPKGDRLRGRIIVLVDSRSSSASELFARFVQQEGRGTVVGDRSAGLVVRARVYRLQVGVDIDVVMADGMRLEKSGVTPDEIVLPSGGDLGAGRDPALARALTLAGHPIDAAAAARLLPRLERR